MVRRLFLRADRFLQRRSLGWAERMERLLHLERVQLVRTGGGRQSILWHIQNSHSRAGAVSALSSVLPYHIAHVQCVYARVQRSVWRAVSIDRKSVV